MIRDNLQQEYRITGRYILIILLFINICGNIYPQRLINLDEARELAIQNNNELKMASEEERVAYYEKKEAFLKYFPKVSANGAYLRNQKDIYLLGSSILPPSITLPIPPSGIEVPIPDEMNQMLHELGRVEIKNVWVGGISLTQPLFMGGRIIAYNDIMKNAEELAKNKKDTKLQDIIVEVDEAYWQVVSLSEKKKLAESYLGLLKKMTSDISIMEEEGVATKADVLSVKVKENEAEVALTKVDNGLSLSRMLLNQLCGIPIEETITLTDENSSITGIQQVPVVPSIEEAWQNRPEIKSLELATKIFKGKEKVARAEFLPEVGLTANYLWTNPSSFNGFEKKFGGMWSVGVIVSMPLNFLTSSSKVNAAKAQTRIQEYQLEEAKEKIELQVNQSAYKLNEAYKKHEASQKNMEKANENLRYANVGFEEGVIPASDALAAHTAWLSAHSELIDAQIDIKLSNVYLNKALGRSLK
ncbi:MAG: TolC family protein [Dysgonomonas sp.]|nr:TolC family protein [Dysgonomonas sp.]